MHERPRITSRKRRKGVDVRPGAVRKARLEAGLSLASLAGEELSRQQIHHVETGRSRPSLDTLQRIAAKTGKPLSYFMAESGTTSARGHRLRRNLYRLELLCLREEWEQAVAYGLKVITERPDQRFLANARALLGQAYVHLVQPEPAVENLRLAMTFAEYHQDEWLLVECMDWTAMARWIQGDGSALSVAVEALRRCRQLEHRVPGVESRILEHIGAIHMGRQDWKEAVRCYEAATRSDAGARTLRRTARMYDNLSQAYEALGEAEKSAAYAHRAIALYARERELRAVAREESGLAELLIREGQLSVAEHLLDRSLQDYASAEAERWAVSFVLRAYGELYLLQGRFEESERFLRDGIEAARRLDELLPLALLQQTLGQLEARRERWEEAERAYGEALRILGELQVPDALRLCHLEYAELLRARGRAEDAAEHYSRAARIGAAASPPTLLLPQHLLLGRTAESRPGSAPEAVK
jgi:tetratricopeptide (TPR) repeat protein